MRISRLLAKAVESLRWLFTSEQLPLLPGDSPDFSRGTGGFPRSVLERDALEGVQPIQTSVTRGGGFLRWVFSTESLPRAGSADDGTFERPRGLWVSVFSMEQLPKLDLAPSRTVSEPGLLRWAFSGEDCPQSEGPRVARRVGLLRWALSPERCPQSSAYPSPRHESCTGEAPLPETHATVSAPGVHRRKGFLRWVLSSEQCPTYPKSPPRRRTGFMAWVLGREEL